MPGTTGRMIPDCPNCASFDSKDRPTVFTLGDGVTHAAPDMWLAGACGSGDTEADSWDD